MYASATVTNAMKRIEEKAKYAKHLIDIQKDYAIPEIQEVKREFDKFKHQKVFRKDPIVKPAERDYEREDYGKFHEPRGFEISTRKDS